MSPMSPFASSSEQDDDNPVTVDILAKAKHHKLTLAVDPKIESYGIRSTLHHAGYAWDKEKRMWMMTPYV
jgi:hypothetical protein